MSYSCAGHIVRQRSHTHDHAINLEILLHLLETFNFANVTGDPCPQNAQTSFSQICGTNSVTRCRGSQHPSTLTRTKQQIFALPSREHL